MPAILNQFIAESIQEKIIQILKYLLKNVIWLILAFFIAGFISYIIVRKVKPIYTATFTFVLSTDQPQSGVSNLAAQLGFDAGSNNSSGIFSGDNIIELFKSRSLIGTALMNLVDTVKHKTFLDLITEKNHQEQRKIEAGMTKPLSKFSRQQEVFFRMIINDVSKSFIVFKKDKKLIFYNITATGNDPEVTYYTAKCLLNEAAKEFIDTKTKNTSAGVKQLQHQADSLAKVLRSLYSSSAAVLDQTYNLNPSITTQRTPIQYNQIRATALGTAYSEVIRNLEASKVTLQRETPLYQIIDEPELPLVGSAPDAMVHSLFRAVLGFILMTFLLVLDFIYLKNY